MNTTTIIPQSHDSFEVRSPILEVDIQELEPLKEEFDRTISYYLKIKRKREISLHLQYLQSEGFQTLINEFGAESTMEAFKAEYFSIKGRFCVLDILKELQPDRKKRVEIFNKMLLDAVNEKKKMDEERRETYHLWGNGGNFYNTLEAKVWTMRRMDSFPFFKNRLNKLLLTKTDEMAGFIFQNEDDERYFMDNLVRTGNDSFEMVCDLRREAEYEEIDCKKMLLNLSDKLENEYKRIMNELNDEYEKWHTKIMIELERVCSALEMSGQDDNALGGALDKVEEQIKERRYLLAAELKKKTRHIIDMKDSLQNLTQIFWY